MISSIAVHNVACTIYKMRANAFKCVTTNLQTALRLATSSVEQPGQRTVKILPWFQ